MPDHAVEEVARSMGEVSDVPIIMLGAKASEGERVAGLHLGTDDLLSNAINLVPPRGN